MSSIVRQVDAVRRFNRFYTRQIGVLQEGLLDSKFSLTEARVFYELANRDSLTASELGSDLALDAGYLSRILSGFSKRGLIRKKPSKTDGRQSILSLTEKGRSAFAVFMTFGFFEVAGCAVESVRQNRVILTDRRCRSGWCRSP